MEGNWGLMVFVDEVCVYHFVYSRMNELCRTLTKMSILEEKKILLTTFCLTFTSMIRTKNLILISISVLQRRWKNIIDQSTFTRSIFIQL